MFYELKMAERDGILCTISYDSYAISTQTAWYRKIQSGGKMSEDQRKWTKDAINEDRRLTIRKIAMINGCSKSPVHRILHEILAVLEWFRVCWVVKKEMCVRLSTQFLRRHAVDQNFLSKIVTVDEQALHYYDPEDKRQPRMLTPSPKTNDLIHGKTHVHSVYRQATGTSLPCVPSKPDSKHRILL